MESNNLKIYIVATPIGNLEDISYRAVRILSEVDSILCEDTRVTKKLLDHYHITTKTQSYHAHSSPQQIQKIIDAVGEGTTFALVSDAGTPTISDPGVQIITELRKKYPDIDVIVIPGASALVTALASTGFSGNHFRFLGFFPHKKGRETLFQEIRDTDDIVIFYESPHRIMKTLTSLVEYLQEDRQLCVARELTKIFEEKVYGTAQEVLHYFQEHEDHVRGEFVIVIDRQ